MINPDAIIAYAQYNEDLVLKALLHNVKKGFYVDVGANHESYHSVTKLFYAEGWSGINIEPIPRLVKEFEKKRKRDINVNLAISNRKGELAFREYPEHDGLSTLSDTSKQEADKIDLPHTDYKVSVDRLDSVFRRHKVRHIDFIKIDVEGYEFEVLQSNDWEKYRPTVVCIEANHTNGEWSQFLTDWQYVRFIFDGLNEYYVAEESKEIMDHFAERATINAHNGLRKHVKDIWQGDVDRIKELEAFTDRQDELIRSTQEALRVAIAELEKTSLKGKPYLRRLKIAAVGLTTGYKKD